MKITIMRDQLIASLCVAPKNDIRQYLNSVYVEASAVETRLTATDGHMILMQRADAKGENEVDGVLRLILPRWVAERVKKDKHLQVIWIDNTNGEWGLTDYNARTTFEPVEGAYVDFRRLIPATTSGEAAQFDPTLINALSKVAKALGTKDTVPEKLLIRHNGQDVAPVFFPGHADTVALLAPLRKLEGLIPPETLPDWACAALTAPVGIESLV